MQDKPTLYRAAQHGFIHPPKEADDGGDNDDDGGDNDDDGGDNNDDGGDNNDDGGDNNDNEGDGGIGLICQEMWY